MGLMATGLNSDLSDKNGPKIFDLEGARKAGVPEDAITNLLKQKFGSVYDYDKAIKSGVPNDVINGTVTGILNDPQKSPYKGTILKGNISNARDKTIDEVKPIADSAATFYGSMTPAGPVTGIPAGIATDALLQRFKSSQGQKQERTVAADLIGTQPGSLTETLANATQNEGINELLGKFGDFVGKRLKGLASPSTINPGLQSLNPTFAQMQDHPKSISSLIEDIWAPNEKSDAIKNSADIARQQASDLIAKTGGRTGINQNIPINIQKTGRIAIDNLNDRFGQGIEDAAGVGKTLNTVPKPGFLQPSIEGPVNLNELVQKANDFIAQKGALASQGSFSGFTDTDKKLLQTAHEIVGQTANGKNPIAFKNAIDLLHGPNGDDGFAGRALKTASEYDPAKTVQGDFADALHSDITNSIKNGWNDPNGKALKAYNDARTANNLKQTLLSDGNFKNLINTQNSPIPQIDTALKDPVQTQRLLNASQFNGVKSNNMRQDLAAYRLSKIWSDADNGVKGIDGSKLINGWNDPEFQKTKDLLYSKGTQDQIGEFINNVSKVAGNPENIAGNFQRIRLTMRGLELGPAIVGGIMSGNPLHGIVAGAGLAGLEIPPIAMAKLFTNPARAAVLQKLVTGAPLNASETQAGRVIMSGLNGSVVYLLNKNGQRTPAKVQDGQVVQ